MIDGKQTLRLGVVGGGKGSFIGPVHRIAARMSDCYELVAGVLSSSPHRSKDFAKELGIQEERAYSDWQKMIKDESERADGMEVIAIMTPNDTHYPIALAALEAGIHIICDKPLCNNIEHAHRLLQTSRKKDLVFCVTYNYSAYPMVRQARQMIQQGEIGEIRQIHLQYIQGYLANEEADTGWRGKPEQGGPSLVVGDIATHAYHLGCYVTGLEVEELMADLGTNVPGRSVDDTLHCLLRLENGAKGSMWITNAAAGAEHGLHFKVFGSTGGLEWHQEHPNELLHRQLNGFERRMTRRKDGLLYREAEQSMRLVIGHPEGYHDAFANLYREVAAAIFSQQDQQGNDFTPLFPTILDGAKGVQFIYSVMESNQARSWTSCRL
ncbi:MAG: Gfo/Idh/MocA family oxidoreductase [Bacteroidota bacterium]